MPELATKSRRYSLARGIGSRGIAVHSLTRLWRSESSPRPYSPSRMIDPNRLNSILHISVHPQT